MTTTEPLPAQADVVIVGGGFVGCAAAYYLAKRGVSAVVIEKDEIGRAQSGRNWGFVVAAFPDDGRMAGRIATEAGSFFDRVPTGPDIYLLMRVLHDWSDDDCRRILKNCRAAMGNGARLLICEQILDPDPASGDPFLYLVDTQMMAMFGTARERSEGEFKALLVETGFVYRNLIPTTSSVCIVEAVAA
jgi:hypothetical protein